MFDRPTVENLKSEVLEVLTRCEVDPGKSRATDNRVNMPKAVPLVAELEILSATKSDQFDSEGEDTNPHSGFSIDPRG